MYFLEAENCICMAFAVMYIHIDSSHHLVLQQASHSSWCVREQDFWVMVPGRNAESVPNLPNSLRTQDPWHSTPFGP
jgi:hypothetical protein